MLSTEHQNRIAQLLIKSSEFFGSQKRYRKLTEEYPDIRSIEDITDIELECLGHGHFYPADVLARFSQYTHDVITRCRNIKVFKIQLNGFKEGANEVLNRIADTLCQSKGKNQFLKILAIHTSHLGQCNLETFKKLLYLLGELANPQLEEVSFQFAMWEFREHQPTFKELKPIIQDFLIDYMDMGALKNKRFRLEMSGWYLKEKDASDFIKGLAEPLMKEEASLARFGDDVKETKPDTSKEFLRCLLEMHKEMHRFIDGLNKAIPDLIEFQIDFRNWHDSLRMKILKKELDNTIKKETGREKSIVSKRYQADDDQKEIKMVFAM